MPRDLTDEELARAVPDRTDDAAGAVGDASVINPDQRAQRNQRAAALGVDPAATEDPSFDAALARAEAANTARDHLAGAPDAQRWISQPQNAAVAHDDTKALSWWDWAKQQAMANFRTNVQAAKDNPVTNLLLGANERQVQNVGNLARTAVTAVDPLADQAMALSEQAGVPTILAWDENGLHLRHATPQEIASPVGGAGTSALLHAAANPDFGYTPPATWEDVKREPLRNILPYIVATGATSAPDMIDALLNLPAYIAARTGEIGQQRAVNNDPQALLDQIDPQGKVRRLPPDATLNDLLIALPAATASALLDRWGAEGTFGLDDVAAKSIKDLLVESGKAAVREGATEGAQQVIEDTGAGIGTRAGLNPAQMADNALAATVGGAGFGGVVRAAGAGGEVVAERQQQQRTAQVDATQSFLDEVAVNAKESKLNGRAPDLYAGAVDEITRGQPHNQLYVDADALVEMFQSRGVDPRAGAEALGISAGDLATARASGGAVTIATGVWAAKVANTDLEAALRPHVTLDPSVPTQAQHKAMEEAAPQLAEAQRLLGEEDAATGAAEQALRERYTAELTGTGRYTAQQITNIVEFRVNADMAQAQRSGMSLPEFSRQFPPERVVAAPVTPARVNREPAAPGGVREAIAAAATDGVSASYLARLAQKESTFNPNAANPASTAVGLYQFVDGTWVGQMRAHGSPEQQAVAKTIKLDGKGRAILTNEAQRQLMALRTDPATSSAMVANLTRANAHTLRAKLGRDPTDGELYLAHFMGAGRAAQLLTADPSAAAATLFPAEAKSNRTIFYDENGGARTVADVRARLTHGFDGGAVDVPEGGATGEGVTLNPVALPEAQQIAGEQAVAQPAQEAVPAPPEGLPPEALASVIARVERGDDPLTALAAHDGAQEPVAYQRVANGLSANAELISQFSQARTVQKADLGGVDAPAPRVVFEAVRAVTDDPQVLQAVIQAIPVEVMNVLTAEKVAPEVALHDYAVFKQLFSIDRNKSIAPSVDAAGETMRVVAAAATKRASVARQIAGALKASGPAAVTDGGNAGVAHNDTVADTSTASTFDPADPRILYQSEAELAKAKPELFYSAAERFVAEKGPGKASPQQWANTLKNAPGVKKEELEWSGVLDWLAAEDEAMNLSVTKAEVQAFLDANGVRVEEVVLGDDLTDEAIEAKTYELMGEDMPDFAGSDVDDADLEDMERGWINDNYGDYQGRAEEALREGTETQFADWTLPGGENYREVLLVLPGDQRQQIGSGVEADPMRPNPRYRRPFTASHWSQPNVIAHTRLTDRTDADGKRVLFVEEVQSDWHQKGRDQGYAGPQRAAERAAAEAAVAEASARWMNAVESLSGAANEMYSNPRFAELPIALTSRWAYFPDNGYSLRSETAQEMIEQADRAGFGGEVPKAARDALEEYRRAGLARTEAIAAEASKTTGIPDAPFKTAWPALVMKRIVRMAAEQGYDRVAWTTGEQQTERYNLSEAVGGLRAERVDEGYIVNTDNEGAVETLISNGMASRGRTISGSALMSAEQINAAFGENIAGQLIAGADADAETWKAGDRLASDILLADLDGDEQRAAMLRARLTDMNVRGPTRRGFRLEGAANLRVGGEGMRAFYDRNLVNITNDIVKKYGVKVGPVEVALRTGGWSGADVMRSVGRDPTEWSELTDAERSALAKAYRAHQDAQPGFNITPELREAALGGFSLFQDDLAPGDKRGSVQLPREGLGDGRQATINLFAASDLSTFLHETGHVFLERLTAMASMPDAPQAIRDDMNAVLEWLNIPSAADISVQEHEKWAEGFEQYLYEGKAPAPTLRGAFEAFRSWLVFIYRRLRGVRLDVTDDIRAVMDRLVATDDQIAQQRAATGMDDGMTGEALGLGPEMTAAYDRLRHDAIAQAQGEADARVLSAVRRQKETWWKRERERVREEKDVEVASRPIYRAFEWLAHGKWLHGDPPLGLAEGVKLDRAAIVNDYGPETLKKLPRGFGSVYAQDGAHPDVVAEAFGYDSGDELIRELTGMEKRSTVVDRETDAAMLEAHPDPIDKVEEIATKANHNFSQQRVMELQYQAMSGRAVHKGIAQAAREAQRSRTVKELRNPDKHLTAERKAAQAAMEAFRKGDLKEGARQKYRQLVAFHTWKAAREASDAIDAAERMFGKVVGGKDERVAKARNMDMVQAARAILGAYGFGRSRDNPLAYMGMIRDYDPEVADMLEPQIAAASEGAAGDVDPMTYDEFTGLSETVASLWNLSRRSKVIEIDGKRIELEEAAMQITDQLSTRMKEGKNPDTTAAMTEGEKIMRGVSGLRASLRRVEHWAHLMDGGKAGPFTRFIWRPISEGADAHRIWSGTKRRALADHLKAIQPTLTFKKIDAPELGHVFADKLELLHALMHTGNESNKRKLLLGGRGGSQAWASVDEAGEMDSSRWDRFHARMIQEGVITKADYDLAQQVWDLLETMKPEAQRAHRSIFGRYFEEVTANAVTTPWGEYRGGYIPATVDTALVQDASLRAEAERINDGGSFMFPSASRGFTKSRVENFTKPLALDIRLLAAHIDKVSQFTHLAAPVRDTLRLLSQPQVKEMLATYDPVAMRDMLLPWLNRSVKQIVTTPTAGEGGKLIDAFFRELRKRTGMNVMFANIVNTAQQITGFSITLVKVKPGFLAKGLWMTMRAPGEIAQTVAEQSPFMADRLHNQSMDAAQDLAELLVKPSVYKSVKHLSERHVYFMQHASQNVVDLVSWVGANAQALAQGKDMTEAVREADAVVRMTQGSTNPEDVSRFETGPAMARLFTQFASYFNMQSNLLGTELQLAAEQKRPVRVAWVILLGFSIPALLADAITRSMRGDFDDDEGDGYLDEVLDWFTGSQFRAATALIPGGGPTINAAVNSFNNKPYDDKLSVSPGLSTMETVAGTPAEIAKLLQGKGDASRTTKDTLTMLGLITGLPLGALGRPLGYAADVAEGDVQPVDAADAVRGAVTGTPTQASKVQ